MDVRTEKLQLIQQILQIDDAVLIQSIKNLLAFGIKENKGEAVTDFWVELSKEQRKTIEKSIKELDEGKGLPHEEVMNQFRKSLQK